jgi:hypothetical protein
MGQAAQYALVYPNDGRHTEKGYSPTYLTGEQVFV